MRLQDDGVAVMTFKRPGRISTEFGEWFGKLSEVASGEVFVQTKSLGAIRMDGEIFDNN